jgi:hypothetical protein
MAAAPDITGVSGRRMPDRQWPRHKTRRTVTPDGSASQEPFRLQHIVSVETLLQGSRSWPNPRRINGNCELHCNIAAAMAGEAFRDRVMRSTAGAQETATQCTVGLGRPARLESAGLACESNGTDS